MNPFRIFSLILGLLSVPAYGRYCLFNALGATAPTPSLVEVNAAFDLVDAVVGNLKKPSRIAIEASDGLFTSCGSLNGVLPITIDSKLYRGEEFLTVLMHEYGHHIFNVNMIAAKHVEWNRHRNLAERSKAVLQRLIGKKLVEKDGFVSYSKRNDPEVRDYLAMVEGLERYRFIAEPYEELFVDLAVVSAKKDPEAMAKMAKRLFLIEADADVKAFLDFQYRGSSFLPQQRSNWVEQMQLYGNHPHPRFAAIRTHLWTHYLNHPAYSGKQSYVVEKAFGVIQRRMLADLDRAAPYPNGIPNLDRQVRDLIADLDRELALK